MVAALRCFAQTYAVTPEKPGTNKAIVIFKQAMGDQSWLYNGVAYTFLRNLNTNPFLEDVKTTTPGGSVVYYGYRYENVPLMYDIERNLLVTTWNDGESLFTLFNDKISEFTVLDHHFIKLQKSEDLTAPVPGFYDDLYTGGVQLLAKRTKILHIVNSHKSDIDQYEYHVQYYLKKAGKYIGVSSRSALISALGDNETELKRFMKDNRSDVEEWDMTRLVKYYDTLTH